MKINFPISGNDNSIFHKNVSSVFNPAPPTIINYSKNYSYFNFFPNSLNNWNTYQNLYSKIILQDKTAINSFKKKKQNCKEYKPFLSNIKVIYNEETDSNKASNIDENEKNQSEKLLGNKTKRKHFNVKKCDIFEINKSTSTNNESFTNKQNRGRKKKEVIEKGNHTKFTDDNMMRKIKCHFFNYINCSLNDSLVDKTQTFLKLDNFINENLKRDYNMDLMNKTIKEIYIYSKISNKYKKKNNNTNQQLVEKIYLENKESETIKILEKRYIEIFDELINDKLDEFCEKKKKKEEKNGLPHEQASIFLDKMKSLCNNYKDWFEKKRGRGGKNMKI